MPGNRIFPPLSCPWVPSMRAGYYSNAATCVSLSCSLPGCNSKPSYQDQDSVFPKAGTRAEPPDVKTPGCQAHPARRRCPLSSPAPPLILICTRPLAQPQTAEHPGWKEEGGPRRQCPSGPPEAGTQGAIVFPQVATAVIPAPTSPPVSDTAPGTSATLKMSLLRCVGVTACMWVHGVMSIVYMGTRCYGRCV